MNATFARYVSQTISSEAFDTKLGQAVCFVAAGVSLIASWWKVTQLDLTEAQLFFGVLLSLCVPLLLVVVGLLLPLARTTSEEAS